MIINDIVENDSDSAKNRNKSPNPIVFKKAVLSLTLAYKRIIKTNRKVKRQLSAMDK